YTVTQALVLRILFSVVGLLFVAPAVLGRQDRGLVLTALANPVLVWFGLISYGIYIWHKAFQYKYLEWSGQDALNASFTRMLLVTLVLSIAAAALSWYLLEKPLMRRRDRVRATGTAS
ncbi:MAG: acyltransferase family protein, partial [Microthrixaceae bacterium]